MKLLLHACCGPCSLEPTRLLLEDGHDITIAYMNSNIHPASEYAHRRDTLLAWADDNGIPVVEGVYDPEAWERSAGAIAAMTAETTDRQPAEPVDASTAETNGEAAGKAHDGDAGHPQEDRCRACYRLRFEEAARYAAEHGFDGIGTTLSVSPWQFVGIIGEELERAGAAYGLDVVFQDFRPYYEEATRRSKELGMYRQNYCGCRLSDAEAAARREERKQQRKAAKLAKRLAHEAVAETGAGTSTEGTSGDRL